MHDSIAGCPRRPARLVSLTLALVAAAGLARAGTLDDLLRDIASGDAGERAAAAERIAEKGADAVAPLAKLLESEDPAAFQAVRNALTTIAHRAGRPEAEEERASVSAALAAACGEAATASARNAILEVLGLAGGEEAVEAIAPALEDPRTLDAACRALAMIPDPAAARTLCDALGDASGRPAARRIAIINALGHKDDDAAAQALAGEAESAEPVEVRLAALEALANSPMSYAYVHLFWSALPGPEEEKPRERRRVWDSMMNVGKAFISSGEVGAASDFGCELLDVAATREETCSAIVLLSHAGRRFAPERIIAALDHEDPQVRAAARSSLARLRGPLAVPTLKARLEKAAPAMQVELLAILARRDEPQAAALAASRLHHDDAAVRAAALRALETLGTAGAAAALIDALDEGSPAIREGAAGVLGRMEGEDVAREIVERSKTATGEIRAALLRALARRGEPAAEDPRRG